MAIAIAMAMARETVRLDMHRGRKASGFPISEVFIVMERERDSMKVIAASQYAPVSPTCGSMHTPSIATIRLFQG